MSQKSHKQKAPSPINQPPRYIEQINAKINELGRGLESTVLRDNQHQQIIEQYRSNIYTLELKFDLLIKMFEEKGLFAKEEFSKRWPLYLKNDIGVLGSDGKISNGKMKVTMYEDK